MELTFLKYATLHTSHLFHWLGTYVELIENFVAHQSVLAPLLLLFIEESGVPALIPGDSVLIYTGYSINKTHASSVWLAFGVAVVAILAGATILFFISKRWGPWVITKLGRFIFVKQRHIAKAERLFKRYGIWTIIIGRHIPGLRIPITIFAAVSGVSYRTFILCTAASTIVWIPFYLYLGRRFGSSVQQDLRSSAGLTTGFIIGLIILFVGLHVVGYYREKHKESK